MAFCQRCGLQTTEFESLDDNSPESQLQLENEITQAQLRLNNLLEERRARKEWTNVRVSPPFRLPAELLRRIFMAAFPPGIQTNLWGEDTPLLLGSVCTTWRSIAWSMPQLWSTVWVRIKERYYPSKALVLEEWLVRSQDFPIEIHMELETPDKRGFDLQIERMWKIVDCVTRHSERWKNVHLDIPHFFKEGKCHFPRTFPKLNSLAISTHPKYPFRNYREPRELDIFQHAPVLTEISLGVNLLVFTFPINPVSRLALRHVPFREAMRLLGRHPNLTHCVFANVVEFRPIYSDPAIEAPMLQSLDIGSEKGLNSIGSLFAKLIAPSLQDLTLRMNSGDSFREYGSLMSVLRPLPTSLVRLCLFRVHIQSSSLVKSLAILPHLRELKLGQMDIDEHLIRNLTIYEDQKLPFLLPNLVELFLIVEAQLLYTHYKGLAEMAQTRQSEPTPERQVARMKSLTIHSVNNEKDEDLTMWFVNALEHFKHLEEGGMKIDLKMLGELRYDSFILDNTEF